MGDSADILVIDDEQVVLDAVAKVCGAQGLQIDIAQDALQGLRNIEKKQYRLIICDIRMPDVDGFQVLETALKRDALVPVIMTTGYATIEHAVRSLGSGAVGYLPKPFTEHELLSALHRGLRYATLSPRDRVPRLGSGIPAVGKPEGKRRLYLLGIISWVRTEEAGTALVGVVDVFLRTMNGVSAIQLSQGEEEIVQGTPCARLTAGEGLVHEVLGPVSGRVLEVNEQLGHGPGLLLDDPYGEGWFYRIVPKNLSYETMQLQCVPLEAPDEPKAQQPRRPAPGPDRRPFDGEPRE